MKKIQSKIFLGLSVISLLVLAAIFLKGILENKQGTQKPGADPKNVLGEQKDNLQETAESLASPINSVIQNTFDSAKETVTQKTVEVEKTIIATLEKEVADFTKSQTDNLKLQICKDWGVVDASSSPSSQ